jgi:putative ABC transport system permease protein
MIVGGLLRLAFDALRANKLRSGLTLLGVMIGVTSVMTIVSALQGMMAAIEADLSTLGPSSFIVARMAVATSDEMYREKIKRRPLKDDLLPLIERGCPLCEQIATRAVTQARVQYRDQALRNVIVLGSTSNLVRIVDLEVAQGRFHAPEDDFYKRNVAYIGETLREKFFEGLDPIGREIKIGTDKYTVIGVAKKKGSTFGNNQDNMVVIPYSVFDRQFATNRWGTSFMVKAVSVPQLRDAQDQVRSVLRAQRHVPYNKEDDFDIVTADQILDMLNRLTAVFRLALIGISSIALVVGGIVVMNIMMVSVTERTREIGIRKAVGARRNHILLQFLFESLMLTLSGGILGIIVGFFAAQGLVGLMEMSMKPSVPAIIAGLLVSSGTGVIFGIYPAMKAARLDPIKALSYE